MDHDPAAVPDVAHAARAVDRDRDLLPAPVQPVLSLRRPQRHDHRRVSENLGQPLAHVAPPRLVQFDDEVGYVAPLPPHRREARRRRHRGQAVHGGEGPECPLTFLRDPEGDEAREHEDERPEDDEERDDRQQPSPDARRRTHHAREEQAVHQHDRCDPGDGPDVQPCSDSRPRVPDIQRRVQERGGAGEAVEQEHRHRKMKPQHRVHQRDDDRVVPAPKSAARKEEHGVDVDRAVEASGRDEDRPRPPRVVEDRCHVVAQGEDRPQREHWADNISRPPHPEQEPDGELRPLTGRSQHQKLGLVRMTGGVEGRGGGKKRRAADQDQPPQRRPRPGLPPDRKPAPATSGARSYPRRRGSANASPLMALLGISPVAGAFHPG